MVTECNICLEDVTINDLLCCKRNNSTQGCYFYVCVKCLLLISRFHDSYLSINCPQCKRKQHVDINDIYDKINSYVYNNHKGVLALNDLRERVHLQRINFKNIFIIAMQCDGAAGLMIIEENNFGSMRVNVITTDINVVL